MTWRAISDRLYHQIGGRKIVRSVPVELNSDQSEVIRLAAACGVLGSNGSNGGVKGMVGCVTRSGVEAAAGWRRERAEAALHQLLKMGMAMIDDGDPTGAERLYWLPCVSPSAAAWWPFTSNRAPVSIDKSHAVLARGSSCPRDSQIAR